MMLLINSLLAVLAFFTVIAGFGGKTWRDDTPFALRNINRRGWAFLTLTILTFACNLVKEKIVAAQSAEQATSLAAHSASLKEDNIKLQVSLEAEKESIKKLNNTLLSAQFRLEQQNQLLLMSALSNKRLSTAMFQLEMPEVSGSAQDLIEFLVSRIPTEFREFVHVTIQFTAINGLFSHGTFYYKNGQVTYDESSGFPDQPPDIRVPGYMFQDGISKYSPKDLDTERHLPHHYLTYSQKLKKLDRTAALAYKDIQATEMGTINVSFFKDFDSSKKYSDYIIIHPEYKDAQAWEGSEYYGGTKAGDAVHFVKTTTTLEIPIPKSLQSQIVDYLKACKHPQSFVYLDDASLVLSSESSLTDIKTTDSSVLATFRQNSAPQVQVAIPPNGY